MNSTLPTIRNDRQQIGLSAAIEPYNLFLLLGNTLRLWWWLGLFLGTLAAIIVSIVVYATFQPEYKASLWLRIFSSAPYIVFQDKANSDQFAENQVHLIRSRLVLGELLERPDVAGLKELIDARDRLDELARRISIRPIGRSEYFAVEYRGTDPESSKMVLQLVVDSYLKLQNTDEVRQQQEVMTLLETEKKARQLKVHELRVRLTELAEATIATDSKGSKLTDEQIASLTDLRKQLVTLDVESAILKIEVQAFENNQFKQVYNPAKEEIELAVGSDQQVQLLEREVADLEIRIKNSQDGPDHPVMKRWRQDLVVRRERLNLQRTKSIEQFVSKAQQDWKDKQETQLAAMKSRLSSYEITRKVVESHVNENLGAIKRSSGETLQLEFLREELKQATQVHDLISSRLLALKTEQSAPSRVNPLENNGLTSLPGETMPYKKMAMAAGGAFALPFVLLFGLELLIRRVTVKGQLEDTGKCHVIGEVANLPKGRLLYYLNHKRWNLERQLYRESVDHLRTCLVCRESAQNVQVMAVTSAVSGEGKTSLALQLAKSLAIATGKQVLLIDGDLRYPNAHEWLEVDLAPGLSDVLSGSSDWKTVLRKSSVSGLYLITAGELSMSPHRLFGTRGFGQLLAKLRPHFRYVIIDTPPLLSASESLVMAKAADVVLLCALRDRSRLHSVQVAHEQLALAGVTSIGTVLTGVPFRAYASRYGVYAVNAVATTPAALSN